MDCPNCKMPVQADEEFCGNCGAPMKATLGKASTVLSNQGNSQQGGLGVTMPPPYTFPVQPSYQQPATMVQPIGLHVHSSKKAVAALIIAGVNLFIGLGSLIIPSMVSIVIILGVVAIALGHIARSDIRRSAGLVGGAKLAVAGLSCGYVEVILGVITLIGYASRPY